jgi:hypothetical protein
VAERFAARQLDVAYSGYRAGDGLTGDGAKPGHRS